MPVATLFLNPKAGRGRAAKRLPELRGILDAAGIGTDVVESSAPGDLEARVREAAAAGIERLIVAGGDGSVHEAVNGIVAGGGRAALGVLPVGTGNDFAKAAGVPLDAALAARQLAARMADGRPLGAADIGRCNDRCFLNGAGIGIDARVAQIAASIWLPIGDLVYLLGVLRCLVEGIHTPALSVSINGVERFRGAATLVNIANGQWVGGRFHIAPDSRLDDGLFDVVIAGAVSRRRVIGLVPLLQKGLHTTAPEVQVLRGDELLIESREPLPCHLDGELLPPGTRFAIRRLPEQLQLL